ncbi:MAG: hypothetical protein R2731_17040 [Nocardioides sp.]
MKAGDPVPLADLVDQPVTTATINAATTRIMAALTTLVADIRGETPPAEPFDPRAAGIAQTGNPHKRKRKS